MGLEDIVEEAGGQTSSSSSSKKKEKRTHGVDNPDDYAVVVGKPPKQKAFTEEQWDKVSKVLKDKMDLVPNKVLNMPPDKRYEILHEAALWSDEDKSSTRKKKCFICGRSCGQSGVEIAGETVCSTHPAAMIAHELDSK